MIARNLPPDQLDLESTLGCGQAFRWQSLEWAGVTAWSAVVRSQLVTLWREAEQLRATLVPGPPDPAMLDDYLDLHLDVEAVRREIAKDPPIQAALERYPGLRVLQQEPWETVITFLLSQNSNVPRIAGNIESLARHFGATVFGDWNRFPEPAELARATEAQLREIGLGYRAPYVLAAARRCAENGTGWLADLARAPYSVAKLALTAGNDDLPRIPGIGPKVADCILLFSLRHYEAFPVDVHVRRAMQEWYGDPMQSTRRAEVRRPGRGALSDQSTNFSSYESVASFGRDHFGRYAGYAQQYLFHRQRTERRPE